MKRILILILMLNMIFLSYCQNNTKCKIIFDTNIDSTQENHKMFGSIANDKDSADFIFDDGFNNDNITIIIDNHIKYSQVLTSEESTAHAGNISVPKTKNMEVIIIINGISFETFKFNKDFCTAHLNYSNKKLNLTYTNQVYIYD